jgi:3-hydroxyacyl-CoA dehydrogenase
MHNRSAYSRLRNRRETRFARGDNKARAGVIGLGLMGSSIATCLLASGDPVIGIEADAARRSGARRRVLSFLREMKAEKVLRADPLKVAARFSVSEDFGALAGCEVVIESIFENVEDKREILKKIEAVVSPETIIGSNTSAIPITILQQGMVHPERVLGIHWGEPAQTLRFMEIICGAQTDPRFAERARELAQGWGKEPSVLRRDIRGFITNRVMYAMLREAFHLVEAGYASIEDVDRSLRNDYGYWITFAGPFRYMDITGIPAYAAVMKDLFPDLDCSREVPALMRRVVDSGARGISNAKGFYNYTPAQAKRWEKLFMKFSYEIRMLAGKYPGDVGDRPRKP